jgi:hypothetical protein
MVQIACSDTLLYNVMTYFGAVLVVILSLACFIPTVRYCPLFMQSLHLWGSTKHFLPVHLTSQWSPYFVAQAWVFTLVLL